MKTMVNNDLLELLAKSLTGGLFISMSIMAVAAAISLAMNGI